MGIVKTWVAPQDIFSTVSKPTFTQLSTISGCPSCTWSGRGRVVSWSGILVRSRTKYYPWSWLRISLTIWYPRHQLQKRIGYFFGAASLAGAFSGLLAYGISFMSGTQGLLGWSWIFVRNIPDMFTRRAHSVCLDFGRNRYRGSRPPCIARFVLWSCIPWGEHS